MVAFYLFFELPMNILKKDHSFTYDTPNLEPKEYRRIIGSLPWEWGGTTEECHVSLST